MTALVEPQTEPPSADEKPVRFASWPARAGALAADVLPGAAVMATMLLLWFAATPWGWLWWVFTVTAACASVATMLNRWVLPVLTGWSLGRALFGVRVTTATGSPAGTTRLLLRDVAHLLDSASLFIGWLWPLWDRRHRTFADLLLRTESRAVAPAQGKARRNAGIVFVVATLLCVAGSGLAYQAVYRYDQAIEQTRAQIAEQGPRIVEQMLTYQVGTVQDDFARAQSLATDSYRPQLVAQQQAVQKAGVIANEYWGVTSAVLPSASPTPDRAAMLIALQGQRGADANTLKFVTATVRADFVKSGDGQWRVDNLIVLKKPQLGGGPAQ